MPGGTREGNTLLLPLCSSQQISCGNVTRQFANPLPLNFSCCVCKSITPEIRRRQRDRETAEKREPLKARHSAFHIAAVWE